MGIHVLCLFDQDRDLEDLERAIGECGVHDRTADSPPENYDIHELLERAPSWNGQFGREETTPIRYTGKPAGSSRVDSRLSG